MFVLLRLRDKQKAFIGVEWEQQPLLWCRYMLLHGKHQDIKAKLPQGVRVGVNSVCVLCGSKQPPHIHSKR